MGYAEIKLGRLKIINLNNYLDFELSNLGKGGREGGREIARNLNK